MKFKNLFRNFEQFFKYCVVGTSSALIDLGGLYLLVEYANFSVIPAATISFLVAVVNGYAFNRIWTFKSKASNYQKQFVTFLLVALVGLALNTLFMFLFVEQIRIWYMFAKVLTSILVLGWSFLANRYWTFETTLGGEKSPG